MIPLKLKLNIVLLLIFHWASGQNNSSNTAIKVITDTIPICSPKNSMPDVERPCVRNYRRMPWLCFFKSVRNRSGDTDFEFHQDPNFITSAGTQSQIQFSLFFQKCRS
ncbi:MAG: hypothetical protein IPP32_18090 [Bacteroidetes bacterium]|nr:hypothetical protein [Bacteroidota bacterium]